jgi:FtsP/CotA-like multicopper oxidase with cupredoxin domain
LTAETISPDGVPRLGFLINGQMPGPKIEANWGDEVIVHLTNGFAPDLYNGTSLHFHGIRQNGTNEMDGVSSITQCPIAPGKSMTYKWTANSYGSSWWHSHYALQTYEGVFGPIVINGPAAMEYDDEVVVMAQDWNHNTVDSLYYPSQVVGSATSGPQTLDTGLINGMNVFGSGGQRFEWTVESGKSYRIRLVNVAIQSTFVFYVDGHKLNVIAMDFVPITPYETDRVVINIGQRYDLILKADQPSADYWMRADNQQPCGQLKNLDIKGIVHYADGPNATPDINAPPQQYAPTCLDEPSASLVPIVPWSAGAVDQTIEESVVIGPQGGNPNLFKWTLSGTTFYAEWENPTLQSIVNDGTIPDTSGNLAIEAPNLGEWVYVIIETVIPLPHPIHLHGHDFLILAQGLGAYSDATPLQLDNPPRRDVAVMPADPTNGSPGFLVVAFYTSNPGVWLMHCHIGWVSRLRRLYMKLQLT